MNLINAPTAPATTDLVRGLAATLAKQRTAFLRDGPPTLNERRRDLTSLKSALLARKNDFVTALNTDFGHRSRHESLLFDVGSVVNSITYMYSNLARWMRPDRRHVAPVFLPGSARVVYQPRGVVGILSPWNFPVSLALTPLATALAAGNRVMLKPSELTPATTELLASMLSGLFSEDRVAVVKGDANVASAFSTLPFDRILFTGSTPIGRAVMRAASEHLVPVTLELGGKSPVIIARDASLSTAARRIAYGNLANGGQSCVSPDYALVPQEAVEAFVSAYRSAVEALYPDGTDNPDYTWIINVRHFTRLTKLLEDARAKGARVIEVASPEGRDASQSRAFPPTIVLDATEEMNVMTEEIFGPILPILPYGELDEAIAYVNAHPRPLALYFFGPKGRERTRVLDRTTSGNVAVNDTILHYAQDDLPFGGVGLSGMGAYHGPEGFKTMSHAKGAYTQPRSNIAEIVRPPFRRMMDLFLTMMLR